MESGTEPVLSPTHHQIWQVLNDKDDLNVSEISRLLVNDNMCIAPNFQKNGTFYLRFIIDWYYSLDTIGINIVDRKMG